MMSAMAGGGAPADTVTLPHDAMIHEKRTPDTKNLHQTGFYPGGIYEYTKQFDIPADWSGKEISLEFEGVYEKARVFVNGDYAGGYPYGYTQFRIDLNDFLISGQPNTIKVVANNASEENSRWYSGSGIYRNVNLLTADLVHIPAGGLKIQTPEMEDDCATVQTEITLINNSAQKREVRIFTQILDADGKEAAAENTKVTIFAGTQAPVRQRILLDLPHLWDVDDPYLYTCIVKVTEGETVLDEMQDHFGIRRITLNAKHGLRLNGKDINLRDALRTAGAWKASARRGVSIKSRDMIFPISRFPTETAA